MNAIETRGLCKTYGDFRLENINLVLPSGCIMGLVGENGAGKSTTIKLIMNAVERDSGEVSIMGTDNKSREFKKLKENIGVVLDEAYFPEVLNAVNVNAVMKSTYKNWNEEQYFNYIDRFSLPRQKRFKDYSRGMKMKLAIAAALSHSPKLLILDEATGGLDPMIRDEILEIFNEFTRDESHSVLISSHIVSDLEKICDYIAFIHNGNLIFSDEKDRLFQKYGIIRMSKENFKEVPQDAVIGKKASEYFVEALVRKDLMPGNCNFERAGIEEIILFMAKEDR
ncbi:MAG: ABC transporter ATP-binding protein [Clostridiales bacterium]|nr:ABC transporter ATP-binding protein [Clostridiales bacterium]